MQFLYGLDCHAERVEADGELDGRIEQHFALLVPKTDSEARALAETLIRGVMERRERIDRLLARASTNWRLERMNQVDRNVLRVAVYELTERPDVPPPVVLDEAIEIARQLGSGESSKFVNGVLNQVLGLIRSG